MPEGGGQLAALGLRRTARPSARTGCAGRDLSIRSRAPLAVDHAPGGRGGGAWRCSCGTVCEIVVHCADSETNAHGRIRYLAAEPDPLIVGYDQEEWARVFDYHARPLAPALATIEAVRANTAALIRSFPEDAWTRVGRHSDSGSYSAEDWLRIYAAHLHDHADQIAANLAAWERRDGG